MSQTASSRHARIALGSVALALFALAGWNRWHADGEEVHGVSRQGSSTPSPGEDSGSQLSPDLATSEGESGGAGAQILRTDAVLAAGAPVDPTLSSPLFGRRLSANEIPPGILPGADYEACMVLNPDARPLSDVERARLESLLDACREEQARVQARALAARHEYILRCVEDLGLGAIPGSQEAAAMEARAHGPGGPGFIATYSSPLKPEGTVFVVMPGDDGFVDDCFDDLWAVAEKNYGQITEFFTHRVQ